MRKSFAAFAFATLALAQPASAITFPKLTTIYVGSGVYDNGGDDELGSATSFHCSNVSGVAVQVRVLVLSPTGALEGAVNVSLAHGATGTISTHGTFAFTEGSNLLNTGSVTQGVVNIEATNSAVFCTAMIVDANAAVPTGIDIHLVRVNPHPGTVK
jgi:hypothetical protein